MPKRIVFPLLAFLVAWFFAEGIPVDVLHLYNALLSLVGATAFALVFSHSVLEFIPKKKVTNVAAAENSKIYSNFLKVCLLIISFFCAGAFLYFQGSERIENEFSKHGVRTIATVTAGALYYTSQKDDRSIICVKFKNKKGEEKTANVDMPPSRFYNYSLDQHVYITYSEMHPDMVKITGDSVPSKDKKWIQVNLSAEELKEQKQQERIGKFLNDNKNNLHARTLNLKNLKQLLNLKGREQITQYLSSIGRYWKFQDEYEAKGFFFKNELNGATLGIQDNGVVYMPALSSESKIFVKEALAEGFTKIDAPVPGADAVLLKDNYTMVILNPENKQDAGQGAATAAKMIALNKK